MMSHQIWTQVVEGKTLLTPGLSYNLVQVGRLNWWKLPRADCQFSSVKYLYSRGTLSGIVRPKDVQLNQTLRTATILAKYNDVEEHPIVKCARSLLSCPGRL